MKSSITKRSVVIGGHKTSVSAGRAVLEGLREIAGTQKAEGVETAAADRPRTRNANLSSAIRVYVLENVRSQASRGQPTAGPRNRLPNRRAGAVAGRSR